MKTCKICKFYKEHTIHHHLGESHSFYTCKIFNEIVRHPKLKSMFCYWFSLNDLCLRVWKEKREL